MGSEVFVASGDKEKAERVSRNERPSAATIEAADATRRREISVFGKEIVYARIVSLVICAMSSGRHQVLQQKTPAENCGGKVESGGDLCSRAVSSQVRSALRGLTSVFGMGTGGTLSSLPPEMVSYSLAGRRNKTVSSFPRCWPHPDNCTAMILTDRFQLVSLGLCVKSSPRPISIIKLHTLPYFHR